MYVLFDFCAGDYSKEARAVTGKKLKLLNQIKDDLLNGKMKEVDPQSVRTDIFDVCCVIRLIYWDREIRYDCADMITHGDVFDGIVQTLPISEYAEKQRAYRIRYENSFKNPIKEESVAVSSFILQTSEYLYHSDLVGKSHKSNLRHRLNSNETDVKSESEIKKLEAVAEFIREGNHMFELFKR